MNKKQNRYTLRFNCVVSYLSQSGATEHEIIICPYPAKVVGLDPRKSRYSMHRDTCKYSLITPDLLTEKYGEAVPECEGGDKGQSEADGVDGGESSKQSRKDGVDSSSDGGGGTGAGRGTDRGLYSTIISKLYKAAKSTATGAGGAGDTAAQTYKTFLRLLNRESKNKVWPFSLLDVVTMTFGPPASTNMFSRLFGKKISDSELALKYDIMFKAGQEAVRIWYSRHPIRVHDTLIYSPSAQSEAESDAAVAGESAAGLRDNNDYIDNSSNSSGRVNYANNSMNSNDGREGSNNVNSFSIGCNSDQAQQYQELQDVSVRRVDLDNDSDRISSRGHPFI